jgi:hypothetical protein
MEFPFFGGALAMPWCGLGAALARPWRGTGGAKQLGVANELLGWQTQRTGETGLVVAVPAETEVARSVERPAVYHA